MGKELDEAIERAQKAKAYADAQTLDASILKRNSVSKINQEYSTYIAPLERGIFLKRVPAEFQEVLQSFKEKVQQNLKLKFQEVSIPSWNGLPTTSYYITIPIPGLRESSISDDKTTENRRVVLDLLKQGRLNPEMAAHKVIYFARKQERDGETFWFGYDSDPNGTIHWFLADQEHGDYSSRADLGNFTDILADILVHNQTNKLTTKPGEYDSSRDW